MTSVYAIFTVYTGSLYRHGVRTSVFVYAHTYTNIYAHTCTCVHVCAYLSGTVLQCRLGGFSGVGATVASFLPTECSRARGIWGIFGKPLKSCLEHLGLHAVLMKSLRFSSVLDDALLAASFCQQGATTAAYKFTPWGLLLPPMHHKSLWCVKGLTMGMQSGCRRLGTSLAAGQKSPVQLVRSNLHAPTRNTRFCPLQRPLLFLQFWECKVRPTKASQQEFLGTCIGVDLDENATHAHGLKYTRNRWHQTTYFVQQFRLGILSGPNCALHVLCTSSHMVLCAQKCDHRPPPNPYISEMAFSHRFQKVSPPTPPGNNILACGTESSENLGKLPNPAELAHYELPLRDICVYKCVYTYTQISTCIYVAYIVCTSHIHRVYVYAYTNTRTHVYTYARIYVHIWWGLDTEGGGGEEGVLQGLNFCVFPDENIISLWDIRSLPAFSHFFRLFSTFGLMHQNVVT